MNAINVVLFGNGMHGAVYLNQRFHLIIDDMNDAEQILEATKYIGRFDYAFQINEDLGALLALQKKFPDNLDEALDYIETEIIKQQIEQL